MNGIKKDSEKNILERIMSVIRVESQFLTDAVIGAGGTQKFEQQLEDAKGILQHAKSSLSEEIAKEMQSSRLIKIIEDRISHQELLIVDSLGQGDENKAFELAKDMVDLEQDLHSQHEIKRSHELHLGHLKRQMELAERTLKDLERQLSMVNTTERIQKATAVITKNFDQADSKMLSAKKSMDRVRRRQQQIDGQYEVTETMIDKISTKGLEAKNNEISSDLEKAKAAKVLQRILDKN